ncbi:MAG: PEGA domain-containing protein [Myxococcales bacterium]|nr:PEGA domain-containing protein [Myxococcales bacterium]
MKTRGWRSVLAVVLAVSMVSPEVAFARKPKVTSVRQSLPKASRPMWDAAVKLTKGGNWDGARAQFLQVYEQSKNPRVLFNVAVCEKNLGRYADAIDYLKRELDEGSGKLTKKETQEIERAITGLEKFVSDLSVEVNVPGAKIYVDGREVGVSPLVKPVRVQTGERRVSAKLAGHTDASAQVDVAAGKPAHVDLKLEALQKTALVEVKVTGASNAVVKIDGKEVGPAPFRGKVAVAPQPVEFAAEAPGFVRASQSVKLEDGKKTQVTLTLAPEQSKGRLTVVTRPTGGLIEIDGHARATSRFEGALDAGSHQVVVKKRGYYTFVQDVEVRRGADRSVTASLNEDRNTNFVPWLIGSVVVLGASAVAIGLMVQPSDQDPVQGTLPPNVVEHR